MPVDKKLIYIYAACLDYYKTNGCSLSKLRPGGHYFKLENDLNRWLLINSEIQKLRFPGWDVDNDNPGYLLRLDAPKFFRVPYHLVPALPALEALEAIWDLSQDIRTLSGSVISLSGSGAMIQSSVIIGDLDFCEYVPSDFVSIKKFLKSQFDRSCIIVDKIKFDNKACDELGEPFDSLCLERIDPHQTAYSYGKVDYVARPGNLRPMGVSNVMIFCDENWESAAKERTFAAQEALFSSIEILPNAFGSPIEVGRYVNWLIGQIEEYYNNNNFTKCLKRCLSLSRLCFEDAVSDSITEFIRNSLEFHENELVEVSRLSDFLSHSAHCAATDWRSRLEIVSRILNVQLEDIAKRNSGHNGKIRDFTFNIATALLSELDRRRSIA